ncbi:MAG: ABC transporter permease, partial [Geminicoccaceae bacterium]|nr:ABC transporter permease [Geminicoccaceae bacterium]
MRPLLIALGLLLLWQAVVTLTGVPRFMLPPPQAVLATVLAEAPLLLGHAATTLLEILLGFLLGVAIGAGSALLIAALPPVQPWLLPILVLGQSVPVFA